MDSVRREVRLAKPQTMGTHLDRDLFKQAPVPQASEHARFRRRNQRGKTDNARQSINPPHKQAVAW